MVRRLFVLLALATASFAVPAAPASALPCIDHPCIFICWDCVDGPYLGCYDIQDVAKDVCV